MCFSDSNHVLTIPSLPADCHVWSALSGGSSAAEQAVQIIQEEQPRQAAGAGTIHSFQTQES